MLNEETIKRLDFGKAPDGMAMKPEDFATNGSTSFEVKLPEGAFGAELQVEAELASGGSGVLFFAVSFPIPKRFRKADPSWRFSAIRTVPGYQKWKSGVLEFARVLPMNSQGEPAPADKDPIPLPYDNTYNQPERDQFHSKVKYYRNDAFLTKRILDDETAARLEQAGPTCWRPSTITTLSFSSPAGSTSSN